MRRAAGLVLAVFVLVPASAGASTARPPLALTATPAHVSIVGSGTATLSVTNPGTSPVVVEAARAGFTLDLRGRPRIVRHDGLRAATRWLAVQPGRFVLAAGASRALTIAARLPSRVEPGDHDALVLLTSHPRRSAAVSVRLRVGVVVVVRAPGRVVRRLVLRRVDLRRAHRVRLLEVLVSNLGNVTETLERGRVRVVLVRGRAQTILRADARDLRPRTNGVVTVRYGGRADGWATARVEIAATDGGPVVRRSFRVKL
jgi:hypothetical protein